MANSAALNGVNSTTHTVNLMTSWRMAYTAALWTTGALTCLSVVLYGISYIKKQKAPNTKKEG